MHPDIHCLSKHIHQTIHNLPAQNLNTDWALGHLNSNQLIINTELIRKSGDKDEFKSIFIDKKAKIFLSFLDANKFELLEPLIIPLNIYDGQAAGVIYRKKGSKNIDEIGGMRILARRQINSLDEFKRIRKIELSIKL